VIQNLIKNTLTDTTVVTIAHRLITVIQYDKIIILEQGKKVEEGSPADLLELEDGWFTKLVGDSGHGDGGNSKEEYIKKMKLAATDHSLDPADLFAE
jgi:ABC-type multidrug transport system ATPase subunit